LAGIPGAELIAAAPLDFLSEQYRGSWISHDNPLATFYLPQQKIIVEVRYRMQKPDKYLSDFASPIWIRFGRIGDIAGFLGNVVVWLIWAIRGGLIDGELAELERVLAAGTRANIVAAAILRPSPSDELCGCERSKNVLCLTLGTQSAALWKSLIELTHLFTSTLMPEGRR
jgi:hypothetical protein